MNYLEQICKSVAQFSNENDFVCGMDFWTIADLFFNMIPKKFWEFREEIQKEGNAFPLAPAKIC